MKKKLRALDAQAESDFYDNDGDAVKIKNKAERRQLVERYHLSSTHVEVHD